MECSLKIVFNNVLPEYYGFFVIIVLHIVYWKNQIKTWYYAEHDLDYYKTTKYTSS